MTADYPLTRAHTFCPCCRGPKTSGLITCWPCFGRHNGRNGFDIAGLHLIRAQEALLVTANERARQPRKPYTMEDKLDEIRSLDRYRPRENYE